MQRSKNFLKKIKFQKPLFSNFFFPKRVFHNTPCYEVRKYFYPEFYFTYSLSRLYSLSCIGLNVLCSLLYESKNSHVK